jgi:hypothetical protein
MIEMKGLMIKSCESGSVVAKPREEVFMEGPIME